MKSLKQRCLAECIGTFILLFFGVGTIIFTYFRLGSLAGSLSFGIVFMLLYYFLEKISGCHLNPVVSFSCFILKKMPIKEALMYSLFQLIGCVCATLLLIIIIFCSGEALSVLFDFHACIGFDNYSPTKISFVVAFLFEICVTAVFVFAYIYFTFKYKKHNLAGIGIGLVYIILCIIGASLTGTCLNPLRALCPAFILLLLGSFNPFLQFFLFLLATYIGGFIACIIFSKVFKDEIKIDTKALNNVINKTKSKKRMDS